MPALCMQAHASWDAGTSCPAASSRSRTHAMRPAATAASGCPALCRLPHARARSAGAHAARCAAAGAPSAPAAAARRRARPRRARPPAAAPAAPPAAPRAPRRSGPACACAAAATRAVAPALGSRPAARAGAGPRRAKSDMRLVRPPRPAWDVWAAVLVLLRTCPPHSVTNCSAGRNWPHHRAFSGTRPLLCSRCAVLQWEGCSSLARALLQVTRSRAQAGRAWSQPAAPGRSAPAAPDRRSFIVWVATTITLLLRCWPASCA